MENGNLRKSEIAEFETADPRESGNRDCKFIANKNAQKGSGITSEKK